MRLRVGTRRSRLARVQTEQACKDLCARVTDLTWQPVPVETSGDRIRDRPLREVGGKGLFLKELDEALLAGTIDCAIHSLKDVPTELPEGLVLAAFPARAAPNDLLISREGLSLEDMAAGATVATSSLRRGAQARAANPALCVQLLRGNVETRLRRLVDGEFDATFLAQAGVARLGLSLSPARALALDPYRFVPAPGQGALCFTARADDPATLDVLATVDDAASRAVAEAERSVARRLGGSCFLPLGAYARVEEARIELVAVLASTDGKEVVRKQTAGRTLDAARLGADLGAEMLAAGGSEIVAAVTATS